MIKNTNYPNSTQNLDQNNWLFQEIDVTKETQLKVQEKIIKIYGVIQQKTIKNIEKKKNNEILQAQIDAYQSILMKIKSANMNIQYQNNKDQDEERQQTEHADTNRQSKIIKNYANHTFQRQSSVFQQSIGMNNQNSPVKIKNERINQSKSRFNSQNQQNEQVGVDKQNMEKQSVRKLYHYNIELKQKEKLHNYRSSAEFQDKEEFKFQHQPFRSDKNLQKNRKNKVKRMSNLEFDFEENIQNAGGNYQNDGKMGWKSRRESVEQKNFCYFSPRASIGDNYTSINSPSKSFLKKGGGINMSTGNLGNKYSAVDIQSMWNQVQLSKPKKNNRPPNIPKGTGKQYIKSLKSNNTTQIANKKKSLMK